MAEKKSASAQVKKAPAQAAAANRVKVQYETEVVPFLMKKFGYKTVMQVPKIEKIVINTGGVVGVNFKILGVCHYDIALE